MEPGRSCPIKISALFPIWPTVRLSLSGPCVKKNPKYSFTETKGCKYNIFTTCISLILQMTIILSVEVETKEEYNTIQIPRSLSLSLSLSLSCTLLSDRESMVFLITVSVSGCALKRSGLNCACVSSMSLPLSYTSDIVSTLQIEKPLPPKLYNFSKVPSDNRPVSFVIFSRP